MTEPQQGEERPLPTPTSLIGAAAALLLIWSMFLFLGDLSGDDQRSGGLLVSILFQLAGAGLMLLSRDRRAANAGVGLSAVAVVPLLVYVFVDVRSPENTFGSTGDITGTATAILMLSALVWLAAHFFGPAGRHGLFLGAALVALWLVGMVQIVDGSIDQVVTPSVESTFVPIGEAVEDPWADDPWADDPWADDSWAEGSGSSTGGSGEVSWDGGSGGRSSDPSTRLGVVSLLFGGAYLFLGAMLDGRGRARQATPLVAAAIPILTLSVPLLGTTLETEGASMLAIALGCTAAWFGARSARRFTAWYGAAAAALGTITFVGSTASDNARIQALVLLMLGTALAVAANALEGGSPEATGPPEPLPPPPDLEQVTAAGPPSQDQPPWAAEPGPPSTPPTAPPTSPPVAPPAGPPPTDATPPALGWEPPASDPTDPWAPPAS